VRLGCVDVRIGPGGDFGMGCDPLVVVLHFEEGQHLPPTGDGAELGLPADLGERVAVDGFGRHGLFDPVDLRGDLSGRERGCVGCLGVVGRAVSQQGDDGLMGLPCVVEFVVGRGDVAYFRTRH
jgi:hypothetical protein